MCFVPWDLLVAGGNHQSPKVGKPGGRNPTAGPVVGGEVALGGNVGQLDARGRDPAV